MSINADHINPFIMASMKMLRDVCQIEGTMGKPSIAEASFTKDSLIIMIGLTGEMKGQVMIDFSNPVACDIASRMTMMQITELDELATSAICELGNMILGNAATMFSANGIIMDITPPTTCRGDVQFSAAYSKNICVPIIYDGDKTIKINISVVQ